MCTESLNVSATKCGWSNTKNHWRNFTYERATTQARKARTSFGTHNCAGDTASLLCVHIYSLCRDKCREKPETLVPKYKLVHFSMETPCIGPLALAGGHNRETIHSSSFSVHLLAPKRSRSAHERRSLHIQTDPTRSSMQIDMRTEPSNKAEHVQNVQHRLLLRIYSPANFNTPRERERQMSCNILCSACNRDGCENGRVARVIVHNDACISIMVF